MTLRGPGTPRGLSASEAALWRQVAATVTPLRPAPPPIVEPTKPPPAPPKSTSRALPPRPAAARPEPIAPARTAPVRPLDRHGLDASWERKLAKAQVGPDLTIDLHGLTLDAAFVRLGAALTQAIAMQARLLLVIAGKSRSHGDHGLGDHGFADHAGRGNRRGAIRAKLLDWLAASPHASRIAAVRPAAPRHGGAGAVYVVLRRPSVR